MNPTPPILDRPAWFGGENLTALTKPHPLTLKAHQDKWGPVTLGLQEAYTRWELTGRGGAHVPSVWKLNAAVSNPGGTVVINAAEGEPGSRKDAALCAYDPHLVLDGAEAGAQAIRATRIVVWAHHPHMWHAPLQERNTYPTTVMQAQGGYTAGESTSVIAAVQGRAAKPYKGDKVTPWGDGPAVLVHNAETWARMAVMVRDFNPSASALITVADGYGVAYRKAVVREWDTTAVLSEVLEYTPYAVLIGGVGGSWQKWTDVAGVSLAQLGRNLGAGVLHPVARKEEGPGQVEAMCEYLATQSANQCGPCMFGLPALANAPTWEDKSSIASLIAGRGACAMPDGAARMVNSAQAVFS